MKKVLILILFLLPFAINAQVQQEWAALFNGSAGLNDEAVDLVVDGSGNAIVTGSR